MCLALCLLKYISGVSLKEFTLSKTQKEEKESSFYGKHKHESSSIVWFYKVHLVPSFGMNNLLLPGAHVKHQVS